MRPEDWISLLSAVGAAILAALALIQYRASNREKRREFRWRQAEMARTVIEALRDSPFSSAALKMLDWEGVALIKPDGTATQALSKTARRRMLRVDDTRFDEPDAEFVRDCFDRLFEDCCLIESYIRNELILAEDIRPYLYHYMRLASAPDEAPVLDAFAASYGYDGFAALRARFHSQQVHD